MLQGSLSVFFFFNTVSFFIFDCAGSSLLLRSLSLVGGSRDCSWSQHIPSFWWLLLAQSTGSRRTDSVVWLTGFSCSVLRGIFPNQG